MTLFDKYGHLTYEAMRAMIEYELDEGDILIFCEHIAECDECSDKYTALLEGEELLEMSEETTQSIVKELSMCADNEDKDEHKKKDKKIISLQIFKFAVAAALTFVIWGTAIDIDSIGSQKKLDYNTDRETTISKTISDFTYNIQGGLIKGMDSVSEFLNLWGAPQKENNEKN